MGQNLRAPRVVVDATAMAQLSGAKKWNAAAQRPWDGGSQLSCQMRRNLGDLGEGFPKLRKVCTCDAHLMPLGA